MRGLDKGEVEVYINEAKFEDKALLLILNDRDFSFYLSFLLVSLESDLCGCIG